MLLAEQNKARPNRRAMVLFDVFRKENNAGVLKTQITIVCPRRTEVRGSRKQSSFLTRMNKEIEVAAIEVPLNERARWMKI